MIQGIHMRCVSWAILLCVLAGSANAEPTPKNVLVLFSTLGQRAHFLDPFEAALRAQDFGQITVHEAYLEYPERVDKSYLESQADTLRRRYSGLKLDVVVVNGPEALEFALHYRDRTHRARGSTTC